jgi:hypothetical protein
MLMMVGVFLQPSAWKKSNEHLNKSLSARVNMLKEVQFQLDVVAAGMKQGKELCYKLSIPAQPDQACSSLLTSPIKHTWSNTPLDRRLDIA